MSKHSALPAEQGSHTSANVTTNHRDVEVDVDTSRSEEGSGPPPSYTDAFVHPDLDVRNKPTKLERPASFTDSPAQLPFDDIIGESPVDPTRRFAHPDLEVKYKPVKVERPASFSDPPAQLPFDDIICESPVDPTRRHLPIPPQQEGSPPMVNPHLETRHRSMHENHRHDPSQSPQHPAAGLSHLRTRPDLPHASSSAPDARGKHGHIAELQEFDPFGNRIHEESPFEAGRRAQRAGGNATAPLSPKELAYANGRMPSIRPGEIMPINMLRATNFQPTFYPPPEAPPFPPTVHTPIRPAHFPPNLHPPAPPPGPVRVPSHRHPPALPHPPQLSRSHSHHTSPPPPQLAPPPLPHPSWSHSHGQPPHPPEPLRANSHQSIPHSLPSQPSRSNSYQQPPLQHDYPSNPPPSRRHTYYVQDGVPPGLAPNGRYPTPSAPLPQGQPQQYPGPPSRTPSQHQVPQPPPPRSPLRESHRQSVPAVPTLPQFAPRPPSPVRLPSQNVRTPQSLGIVHAPPSPSGSPRPDSSRPPRPTPKPVMPQLLAPLAAQQFSFGRGGAGQLQRSSTSAVSNEKGGFLSKTKSILRKRSSTNGIRTHADGGISFSPTMPNMMEESENGGGKLGKKLSRRK